MSQNKLEEIKSFLKKHQKYSDILSKLEGASPPPRQFLFEALFAYTLETSGIPLEYEVKLRDDNNESVDFVHLEKDGTKQCFELSCPELSDTIQEHCTLKETDTNGVSGWSIELSSSNSNEHMRPEAMTIRLQEKILEKVSKLPPPSDDTFTTIVINCCNFQFGHLDLEDCRMVMHGKTKDPLLQENWDGSPIKGMLDKTYDKKGAKELRDCITSVIFVQEHKIDSLNVFEKAFLVLNNHRDRNHLNAFWKKLQHHKVFGNLKIPS